MKLVKQLFKWLKDETGLLDPFSVILIVGVGFGLYCVGKAAEPYLYSNRDGEPVELQTVHEFATETLETMVDATYNPVPGTKDWYKMDVTTGADTVSVIPAFDDSTDSAGLLRAGLASLERGLVLQESIARGEPAPATPPAPLHEAESFAAGWQEAANRHPAAAEQQQQYLARKEEERSARLSLPAGSHGEVIAFAGENRDIRIDMIRAIDGIYQENIAHPQSTSRLAQEAFFARAAEISRGALGTAAYYLKHIRDELKNHQALASEELAAQRRLLKLHRQREAELQKEVETLEALTAVEGVVLSPQAAGRLETRKRQLAETRGKIDILLAETGLSSSAEVSRHAIPPLSVSELSPLAPGAFLSEDTAGKQPADTITGTPGSREPGPSAPGGAAPKGLSLGDAHGGGIVAHINEDGTGGLLAWPSDLGEADWETAMEMCSSLGDGWRLPTLEELELLYQNRDAIGGFALAYYWSSTESYNWPRTAAATLHLSNGRWASHWIKSDPHRVRAVRSF